MSGSGAVQRTSMADQAAEVLLDRLRAEEWGLGARLPGETTLAAQLGVGRSTVREAIRQLSGRGVLTARQGAGVFVAALDVRDDWDAVLQRADIVSVIEARTAIETEAAALASERRTANDLRAIRRALKVREQHRSDLEEHVDADLAFHRAIVVAAANPILTELFDGFTPRLRQTMIAMLRIRSAFGDAEDHAAHERLADAIRAGDAALAAGLSREHLASLKDGLR
ncbi:FCD domain-containing protein [Microbacterium sp. 13-71-7]|jgi:DNA-binding FadR family transcriptional regulator|uniref:FadR/GntR family transcriptional regulator n=1 Tax=Microbacterium sp. 13-71-7 TaxID=1970399 RepID=UPI0025E9FFA6|nr:FCD domain-containing protein [Microbacterium sp. 13-71-7]